MTLYSPNGSALRAARSRPEPNLETEAKVREQLKRLDELLDIRWFPFAVYDDKHHDFEGRYALVCQWPSNDSRWELFRRGEIEDAVDMVGWYCLDIHDANSIPVSPDAMENKILELLHECDAQRIPHATRMAQVLEKNKTMRQRRKDEMTDRAGEIAKDLHYISGHVEEVTLQRIMKEVATDEG